MRDKWKGSGDGNPLAVQQWALEDAFVGASETYGKREAPIRERPAKRTC